MAHPPITRAEWIFGYIDVFRSIGVSVERELERSALPTWIEDMPDAYISVPLAISWIVECNRDLETAELAYMAAIRQSLTSLSPAANKAVVTARTGMERILMAMKAAAMEDSSLAIWGYRVGDCIRLVCDTLRFDNGPGLCLAEWVNQQAMVDIMRSVAGPGFSPIEMTFVSNESPCRAAAEAFGDTCIRIGQPHTTILVRAADLERPCFDWAPPMGNLCLNSPDLDFVATLRKIIRPYLGDGHPTVSQIAKIIGTSPRTMQRHLQSSGYTYASLLSDVRIEAARDLLADPALKIVDISLALGYGDPQNFSRGFRQRTGVTPSGYRRSITAAV